MKKWFSQNWLIVLSGLVIGAAAVTLTALGNPGNMGFCIACFLRDTSGALGLHSAPVVQYFRPEIVGIVLGALIAAIAAKEFKGHGGSSPVLRFVLGAFVMIGALMFLGCPLRMVIRLGGGDLNALVGLVGFIAGILVGIVFLKKGFSLQRSYRQMKAEGAAFPLVLVGLYVVYLLFKTAFKASEEGPGSMHAAIGVALAIGVIVGILCQRSRMCMVGGIRNSVMFRDFGLISGFLAILIAVIIGNLILGKFNLGFEGQPIAHTDGVGISWAWPWSAGSPSCWAAARCVSWSSAAKAIPTLPWPFSACWPALPSAITLAWPPLRTVPPPTARSL